MKVRFELQHREDTQDRRQIKSIYIDTDKISEVFSNRDDGSRAVIVMDNGNRWNTEEDEDSIIAACYR